jgi:predicted nucleic acid-binding protein
VKRVLLDVNIVLDFILDRAPHSHHATALWAAAEEGEIEAVLPAHGVTTVFYLAARQRDAVFAHRVVSDLLVVPTIAAVDRPVLARALTLGWRDFEDAVCAAAAEATGCDLLVTRDPKGYPDSPVLVVDPSTAVVLLGGPGGPDEVAEGSMSPRRRPRGRQRGSRAVPRQR